MIYKDLNKLLEHFQLNDSPYKKMLRSIPLNQFFSVQNWPQLQKNLNKYMIFWLHRSILLSGALNIDTQKSFQLPIGVLHYLLTDTLSVGCIVELPKRLKLEVTPSYVNCVLGKASNSNISDPQEIPDLNYALHGKHLCVYDQNTSQIIAANSPMVDFLT